MSEPIIMFKDIYHAKEVLKEWQKKLFLTDWLIDLKFDSELKAFAEVAMFTDVQSAIIKIHPLDEYVQGRTTKYCAEKSLIHELLHLKLDLVEIGGDSPPIEAVVFNYYCHQKIEQLAKSFIMTKYGVDFEWFKGFE